VEEQEVVQQIWLLSTEVKKQQLFGFICEVFKF
jgi:hypothetical protein